MAFVWNFVVTIVRRRGSDGIRRRQRGEHVLHVDVLFDFVDYTGYDVSSD